MSFIGRREIFGLLTARDTEIHSTNMGIAKAEKGIAELRTEFSTYATNQGKQSQLGVCRLVPVCGSLVAFSAARNSLIIFDRSVSA